MIPEIQNPSDWYAVDNMLKRMVRNLPEFRHDYTKLANTIDNKIKELSLIDIELRKKNSVDQQNKRKSKIQEINDIIKIFSKMHLLASLAKR